MHEYGLVDDLIAAYLKTPRARALPAVRRLVVRYGPGLTPASVRQAFRAQSRGTPLATAQLTLEPLTEPVDCRCGRTVAPASPHDHDHDHDHDHGDDAHDHDHGLPYMECPGCGEVLPIPHFDALEIADAA